MCLVYWSPIGLPIPSRLQLSYNHLYELVLSLLYVQQLFIEWDLNIFTL
jgi:hypothetical protein